jgi:Fe-S oxidoreductase
MGGYDRKGREIIADFARVMNFLGASFGVLRKEKCCGDPVRRLGNDLVFQQLAESNLEAFAQNKVKKVVSICPHCVRTIQEDWKEYGTPPPVEHHSEFLARFAHKLPSEGAGGFNPRNPAYGHTGALAPEATSSIAAHTPASNLASTVSGHDLSRADKAANSSGALAPAAMPGKPETIVYHDPCYLGRYRNVYKQPRSIIKLAGKLVEAPRNHERSFCCGAGGGLVFLGEETGERVGKVRAAELIATGAQTIATACPFCNSIFRDALAETGEGAPQLLDIAQLTARGLPKGEVS